MNRCNLHEDCEAADLAVLDARGVRALHCSEEDCTVCAPVCTCLTDPGFSCLACDGPLVGIGAKDV